MAILLNRKYGSRLECLYYILQSLYSKFGTNDQFALKDIKFDDNETSNVHHYCQLLIPVVGRQCCPYLDNPLDTSKCYATQSVVSDSTKSKAVSDIGGSLEALGFIERISKRKFKISAKGEKWVNTTFDSKEWEDIAREGVLSYGVAVGFLSRIDECKECFSTKGLYLGYPNTIETVDYTDKDGNVYSVRLSTDSQRDSNTRTMSRLIAWFVAVGLIEPIGVQGGDSALAHIRYRDFINEEELTIRRFKKTELCKHVFDEKFLVRNPLSYTRLHKNVGSLRENGGEIVREATLANQSKILDRRYVFVYALNLYSMNKQALNLKVLVEAMKAHSERFFSSGNDAYQIMLSECEIADIAGLPFEVEPDGVCIRAKTTIDTSVLNSGAPEELVELANSIINGILD